MTTTTSATAGATGATAANTSDAATKLAGNRDDFLKLLMTQLKNQDPTQPMDTNQFTSQLVQFSSVEQQIAVNTNLTKLIQATQGNTLLQSSALVGHTVEVNGTELPLQNGKGTVRFPGGTSQAVTVGIYSKAGLKLREAVVPRGSDGWTWDGGGIGGRKMPDGGYTVVATGADGKPANFTVQGTATAVQRNGEDVKVSLGTTAIDLSTVRSIN